MRIKIFLKNTFRKLKPVDFASAGIFLAGLAHGPKNLEENIAQAKAAAARSLTILSQNKFEPDHLVATVNPDKCTSCLTCFRLCPFKAPQIKASVIEVEPSLCRGCGTCIGECPHQAITTLQGYSDRMYLSMYGSQRGVYSPCFSKSDQTNKSNRSHFSG